MVTTGPEHAVELLDRAFNDGDLEAVLSFYEDAAVVVTEPGETARGTAEIRSFFEQVINSGLSATQLKTHILEADGVALFLSRWTLRSKGSNEETASQRFIATTVFRKQPNGALKALIDNPFGPLVLGTE